MATVAALATVGWMMDWKGRGVEEEKIASRRVEHAKMS